MKAKIIFSSTIMAAVLSLGAAGYKEPAMTASATLVSDANAKTEQLRITAQDILNYLQGPPHYHWACCAEPIPGTSNWTADIEEGGTATVFVSNGIITGHMDQSGF